MFGTKLASIRDSYNLGTQQQQDTQQDLGGLNKDLQTYQQNASQNDQSRNAFNTSALGDYSGYITNQSNAQNQFKTQGLGDFNAYQTQKLGDQQQNFNTVDAQMNTQQQFKDNQQQQNTQYMEAHPLNMQYNNGQTTQSYTAALKHGGSVRDRYAPGGGVADFKSIDPRNIGPIQQVARPGESAGANQPGGYGYTLTNSGFTPSPWPSLPNIPGLTPQATSGAGSINGNGNLSPTASGGNITFNPVINTGDGTATGGGGSSGNNPSNPQGGGNGFGDNSNLMQYMMLNDELKNRKGSGLLPSESGEKSPLALTQYEHGDPRNNGLNVPGKEEEGEPSVAERSAGDGTERGSEMTSPSSWESKASANIPKEEEKPPFQQPSAGGRRGGEYELTSPSSWESESSANPTEENNNNNGGSGPFSNESKAAQRTASFPPLDSIPEANEEDEEDSEIPSKIPPKPVTTKNNSRSAAKPRWNITTNPESKWKEPPPTTNTKIQSKGMGPLPFLGKVGEDVEKGLKHGGSVGRQRYFDGGQLPQPAAPQAPQGGAFAHMEQSYDQRPGLPQGAMGRVADFAQNGLSQQMPQDQSPGALDTLGHLAPLAMLAMREGGRVPSFKDGGMVSDQPIFTRAGSLKERSTMDNHPFKVQNRSQQTSNRFGNYGGFEVSNDDDCPRLDLPFKPGFSR